MSVSHMLVLYQNTEWIKSFLSQNTLSVSFIVLLLNLDISKIKGTLPQNHITNSGMPARCHTAYSVITLVWP